MSLSILLLLVSGGILGIGVLLHLLGLSSRRVFEDEDAVRRVWLTEFPGQAPSSILMSKNQHYALVVSPNGLGLVWPMGVDGAARLLLGAEVKPWRKGLTVELPDFSAPRIQLHLDKDEARQWRAKIEESR